MPKAKAATAKAKGGNGNVDLKKHTFKVAEVREQPYLVYSSNVGRQLRKCGN